jgi:hypothetical protein
VSQAVGALDRGGELVTNDGSDHPGFPSLSSGRPVPGMPCMRHARFVYDFGIVAGRHPDARGGAHLFARLSANLTMDHSEVDGCDSKNYTI